MAYCSQEEKARIALLVKPILKKYGMKGTLSVLHHSKLVLTLASGKLDIIGNARSLDGDIPESTTYINVNHYWFGRDFNGEVVSFLREVIDALNDGNWDASDPQTDYFSVGKYIAVDVGRWDKPYIVTK